MKEIMSRRSIRKYTAEAVADADLQQIIESARLAPSGSNTQPTRFLIVRDEDVKRKIVMADHEQEWMMTAPVFIVCAVDIACRNKRNIMAPWMKRMVHLSLNRSSVMGRLP